MALPWNSLAGKCWCAFLVKGKSVKSVKVRKYWNTNLSVVFCSTVCVSVSGVEAAAEIWAHKEIPHSHLLILPSSRVSAVLGKPSCRCSLTLSPSVYPNTLFRLLWKLCSAFTNLAGIICTSFFLMQILLCGFLGLGHLQLWSLRHRVLCGFSLICFHFLHFLSVTKGVRTEREEWTAPHDFQSPECTGEKCYF